MTLPDLRTVTPLQVHTAAAQGLIHDAAIAGDE